MISNRPARRLVIGEQAKNLEGLVGKRLPLQQAQSMIAVQSQLALLAGKECGDEGIAGRFPHIPPSHIRGFKYASAFSMVT